MPACRRRQVRCFLMDDRGYFITHRDLTEPNNEGHPEEKHITHKEPLVADDILNHRGFVHKKVCSSFGDRTVQRYYQFNVSLAGVITNLVHGEHCSRYLVVPVAGTNAFLGIVNQSCDMSAFCPCSTVSFEINLSNTGLGVMSRLSVQSGIDFVDLRLCFSFCREFVNTILQRVAVLFTVIF